MMTQPHIPSVMSDLRQDIVQMPEVIKNVVAFAFYGRRILFHLIYHRCFNYCES